VRRSMSWLLMGVLGLAIVGFARPAAAQDVPSAEVAGGWNYFAARSNEDNDWEHFYKGGFGEVAVNLNSKWGVVANIGYAQKTITDFGGDTKVKVLPYLFGVRYSSRTNSKNTPFLHVLFGATNLKAEFTGGEESHSPFTWQAGGGVNINANGRLGARVGGDYFRIHGDPENFGVIQGLRLTAGVVVGIGSK